MKALKNTKSMHVVAYEHALVNQDMNQPVEKTKIIKSKIPLVQGN